MLCDYFCTFYCIVFTFYCIVYLLLYCVVIIVYCSFIVFVCTRVGLLLAGANPVGVINNNNNNNNKTRNVNLTERNIYTP
jgi:hypothetical protein